MSEPTLPSVADLYTAYHSVILRFLAKWADPELCEEISARLWCKVATQGLPEKTKAESSDARLLCIMARGLLSDYRKGSRRSDNVPEEVWEFVPGSYDIDTASELLETLPPDLRSLAVALQNGDSVDTWAASQGIPRSTAFRMQSRLREILS